MKITLAAIDPSERRLMRKATWSRIVVLLLLVIPAIAFIVYISSLAIMSFVDGNYDVFSFLVPGGAVIFFLAANKFILPPYKNIFTYAKAETKQVIETRILHVSSRYSGSFGFSFLIETTYGRIDSRRDIIFIREIAFTELRESMTIYLHMIPGTKNEFLKISAQPS